MKRKSHGFVTVPLPHGYTTKVLLGKAEKLAEHQKLLSGRLPWANQDFLGMYDPAGTLSAIVIANHGEQTVFRVTGAGYGPLNPDAQEAMSVYLVALDYTLSGVFNKALDKCILGSDGKFYGISELPDELHVRGEMNFQLSKEPVRLPRKVLIVDGDLDLRRSQVESFPTEFLQVKGDLFLTQSNIVNLPPRVYVGGSFSPSAETKLLPSNLRVGDILSIGYTQIKSVPSGTKCGRLFMSEHQIAGLPMWLNPLTEIHTWRDGHGSVSMRFARVLVRRLTGRPVVQFRKD
jgi:hypothetical protein